MTFGPRFCNLILLNYIKLKWIEIFFTPRILKKASNESVLSSLRPFLEVARQ